MVKENNIGAIGGVVAYRASLMRLQKAALVEIVIAGDLTLVKYQIAVDGFLRLISQYKGMNNEDMKMLKTNTRLMDLFLENYMRRNRAGAIAKAKKDAPIIRPKKKKVTDLHAELKAKHGRNPQWDTFIAELANKRYPKEEWSEETVRGWWKKLNKGEAL